MINFLHRLFLLADSLCDYLPLCFDYSTCSGEKNKKFYFVTVANKEHPVEYAKRIIVEPVSKLMKKGFDKKEMRNMGIFAV